MTKVLLGLVAVALAVALGFFMTGLIFHKVSAGTITDKRFVASHLVCTRSCYRVDDCYRLYVSGNPWYDNYVCVNESYYDTVAVGDYYPGEK